MKYDPYKHKRRSIRLKGYDYSQPGSYFVTICSYKFQHLFGEIVDGKMVLNPNGRLIRQCWHDLLTFFDNIKLGAFIIMPNHLHGIVVIKEVSALLNRTLGQMVGQFKYNSTRSYNVLNQTEYVRLWQRNFYEHIVRNQREYEAISHYILNNPQNWPHDPDRT